MAEPVGLGCSVGRRARRGTEGILSKCAKGIREAKYGNLTGIIRVFCSSKEKGSICLLVK